MDNVSTQIRLFLVVVSVAMVTVGVEWVLAVEGVVRLLGGLVVGLPLEGLEGVEVVVEVEVRRWGWGS